LHRFDGHFLAAASRLGTFAQGGRSSKFNPSIRESPNRDSGALCSGRVRVVKPVAPFRPHGVAFRDAITDIILMRPPHSYRDDPAVPHFADDKPIIIFDGNCVLCSGSAAFVLQHDPAGTFRLLAAQSPLGCALYAHYRLDPKDYETMILIADGVAHLKSEAAIRIAQALGFPWSLALALRIVPRRLRDAVYAWVARNRLRWFGVRTVCYRPDAKFAGRFLA